MEFQSEDRLALVLTGLETLVGIWADLSESGADCTTLKSLITQTVEVFREPEWITASSINLKHYQRSATMLRQCHSLEKDYPASGDGSVTNAMADVILYLFYEKMIVHKAFGGLASDCKSSESDQLHGLEEWLEIKESMEPIWAFRNHAKDLSRNLRLVITHDLSELQLRTETEDDLSSMDILKLGAKIRKDLSSTQQGLLDRFLEQKISAMKGSNATTSSANHTPSTSLTADSTTPEQSVKNVGRVCNQSTMCNDASQAARSNTASSQTPFLPNAAAVDGELDTLQKKIQELEAANSGLMVENAQTAKMNAKLTHENEQKSSSLKKRKSEKAQTKLILAEEKEAYAILLSAYQEDQVDWEKTKRESTKTKELLEEAEEDMRILRMESTRLIAGNAQLEQEISVAKAIMPQLREDLESKSKLVDELVLDNTRSELALEEYLTIEEAWKNYASIVRTAKKLKTENVDLRVDLAEANLALSEVKSSLATAEEAEMNAARYVYDLQIEKALLAEVKKQAEDDVSALNTAFDQLQSCVLATTLHYLTAEKARLEAELASANSILDQIHAPLQARGPRIVARQAAIRAGQTAIRAEDDNSFADYDGLEAEEWIPLEQPANPYSITYMETGNHAVADDGTDDWSVIADDGTDAWSVIGATSAMLTPEEDDLIDLS